MSRGGEGGPSRGLADVQELIRALSLPRAFSSQLHEYVRPEFERLWDAVAADPTGG